MIAGIIMVMVVVMITIMNRSTDILIAMAWLC